jgi:hypothetical protein
LASESPTFLQIFDENFYQFITLAPCETIKSSIQFLSKNYWPHCGANSICLCPLFIFYILWSFSVYDGRGCWWWPISACFAFEPTVKRTLKQKCRGFESRFEFLSTPKVYFGEDHMWVILKKLFSIAFYGAQ